MSIHQIASRLAGKGDANRLKDVDANNVKKGKPALFGDLVIDFIEEDIDTKDLPIKNRDEFVKWLGNYLKDRIGKQSMNETMLDSIYMAFYFKNSGSSPKVLALAHRDKDSLPSVVKEHREEIRNIKQEYKETSLAPEDEYFLPWLVKQLAGIRSKKSGAEGTENNLDKMPSEEDVIWVRDWHVGSDQKGKINDVSFTQAKEESDTWHEHGAGTDSEYSAYITPIAKNKVYEGYGFIVSELSKEKLTEEEIENDCAVEGNLMKNCVGSIYTERVKKGKDKIFSLREASPPYVPRVTIQFINDKIKEIKEYQNKQLTNDTYKLPVFDWLISNFNFRQLNEAEGDVLWQIPQEIEDKMPLKWDSNDIKFYRATRYQEKIDPKSLDYKTIDNKVLGMFVNAVEPISILQCIARKKSSFVDDDYSVAWKSDVYNVSSGVDRLGDTFKSAGLSTVNRFVEYLRDSGAELEDKFGECVQKLDRAANGSIQESLNNAEIRGLLTKTFFGIERISNEAPESIGKVDQKDIERYIKLAKDTQAIQKAVMMEAVKNPYSGLTKMVFDTFSDLRGLGQPDDQGTFIRFQDVITNQVAPTRKWKWPNWVRSLLEDPSKKYVRECLISMLIRSRDSSDVKLAMSSVDQLDPKERINSLADVIHITGKEPFIELMESIKNDSEARKSLKDKIEAWSEMRAGNVLSVLSGYEILKYLPGSFRILNIIKKSRGGLRNISDATIKAYEQNCFDQVDKGNEIRMMKYTSDNATQSNIVDMVIQKEDILKEGFALRHDPGTYKIQQVNGRSESVKTPGIVRVVVVDEILQGIEKCSTKIRSMFLSIYDELVKMNPQDLSGQLEMLSEYHTYYYTRLDSDSITDKVDAIRKSVEVTKMASYQMIKMGMNLSR